MKYLVRDTALIILWVSDFVRVLGIEVVFNAFGTGFVKILGGDLDQVRDLGLRKSVHHESSGFVSHSLG